MEIKSDAIEFWLKCPRLRFVVNVPPEFELRQIKGFVSCQPTNQDEIYFEISRSKAEPLPDLPRFDTYFSSPFNLIKLFKASTGLISFPEESGHLVISENTRYANSSIDKDLLKSRLTSSVKPKPE